MSGVQFTDTAMHYLRGKRSGAMAMAETRLHATRRNHFLDHLSAAKDTNCPGKVVAAPASETSRVATGYDR